MMGRYVCLADVMGSYRRRWVRRGSDGKLQGGDGSCVGVMGRNRKRWWRLGRDGESHG